MTPFVQDIDPVAFTAFGVPVRWYGLSYLAGFLAAQQILKLRARQDGRYPPSFEAIDYVLYAALGAIIGGRLGEVLFYGAGRYLDHPLDIVRLWQGGMSSHGGMIGVAVATLLYSRRHRVPLLVLLDDVVLASTPGLFLGRIANFVNSEMIGKPSVLPWAVIFPSVDGTPRHPVQIYQAIAEGPVLAAILLFTMRFRLAPGQRGSIFLIAYGVMRIVTEWFRQVDADYLGDFLGLTNGQWLSLAMIVAGLALFFLFGLRGGQKR